MKMRNIYITLLCFFVLASCNPGIKNEVNKQEVKTKQPSQPLHSFLIHYENIFKSNLTATGVPGAAVAIVKDTSTIYIKGFGLREIGKPDSVNVHTIFRIGSLSKGFTTVLVSLLGNRGILSWEDKVIDFVPNFALKDTAQTKRIKIKHLLSHTTGLPRQSLIEMIEDGRTMQEMIPQLKKLKIEGKEGEVFGYQNMAFSIIQEIIQVKTSKSLEQWIQEEIFTKANMRDASMTYEALMQATNKAIPHIKNGNQDFEARDIHDKYYNTAAAGGVNASIADMAQWLHILLGNQPKITPKGSLDYIFTPFIDHKSLEYFDTWSGITKASYGMGWNICMLHGRKIIYHGGTLNDYKTELAIDPESRIGICIMFNAQNAYARLAIPNFLEMYYMYQDLQKN